MFDLPREELNEYFRRAKFYWHAMGLGAAEDNPLKMEHFGMTSAEALTFGCVPIVIDRGGQKEIVTEENGCRFSTEEELVQYTAELIRDPRRTHMLACNALKSAERYSMEKFRSEIRRILESEVCGSLPRPLPGNPEARQVPLPVPLPQSGPLFQNRSE